MVDLSEKLNIVSVAEKFRSEVDRKFSAQGECPEMSDYVAESHVEVISGYSTQRWIFAANRSRNFSATDTI